ncbi:hypothetical protein DFJ74DRAFT_762822, partial [Hyaloraphidium curvatum]
MFEPGRERTKARGAWSPFWSEAYSATWPTGRMTNRTACAASSISTRLAGRSQFRPDGALSDQSRPSSASGADLFCSDSQRTSLATGTPPARPGTRRAILSEEVIKPPAPDLCLLRKLWSWRRPKHLLRTGLRFGEPRTRRSISPLPSPTAERPTRFRNGRVPRCAFRGGGRAPRGPGRGRRFAGRPPDPPRGAAHPRLPASGGNALQSDPFKVRPREQGGARARPSSALQPDHHGPGADSGPEQLKGRPGTDGRVPRIVCGPARAPPRGVARLERMGRRRDRFRARRGPPEAGEAGRASCRERGIGAPHFLAAVAAARFVVGHGPVRHRSARSCAGYGEPGDPAARHRRQLRVRPLCAPGSVSPRRFGDRFAVVARRRSGAGRASVPEPRLFAQRAADQLPPSRPLRAAAYPGVAARRDRAASAGARGREDGLVAPARERAAPGKAARAPRLRPHHAQDLASRRRGDAAGLRGRGGLRARLGGRRRGWGGGNGNVEEDYGRALLRGREV